MQQCYTHLELLLITQNKAGSMDNMTEGGGGVRKREGERRKERERGGRGERERKGRGTDQ